MHPMARGLVGGKDAVEVNSQYDVFDFVFLSFRAHSAFSLRQTSFHLYHCKSHHRMYVCNICNLYVCMLAGPRASLRVLQRPCQELRDCGSHRREECSILENAQSRCTRHGAPVPPCTSTLKTAVVLFLFYFFLFSRMLFVGGRRFRNEFATK